MRHSLLVPLRLFLAATVLGALVSLLVCLNEGLPFIMAGTWPPTAFILHRLVSRLDLVLLVSLLAACLIVLAGLPRRSGLLPVSLGLLYVCVFCGLYAGLLGVRLLRGSLDEIGIPAPPAKTTGYVDLDARGGTWLAPVGGGAAGALVVWKPAGDPQLAVRSAVAADPVRGGAAADFRLHILHSLRLLAERATPAAWFDQPALALNGALALFLLGLWTFMRLTRWPLFNCLSALGLLVAAVTGFGLFGPVVLGELRRLFVMPALLAYLPALALAAAGLLLLAINLFRMPMKAWKREMGYE